MKGELINKMGMDYREYGFEFILKDKEIFC